MRNGHGKEKGIAREKKRLGDRLREMERIEKTCEREREREIEKH